MIHAYAPTEPVQHFLHARPGGTILLSQCRLSMAVFGRKQPLSLVEGRRFDSCSGHHPSSNRIRRRYSSCRSGLFSDVLQSGRNAAGEAE
jgi:hypothetical protein